MPETPIFDIPYPTEEDAPDGPLQIQAAVDRLEELLTTIEGLILGAPAPGDLLVVNGTSDPVYKAITGDVGFNSAGVATIGNEKIVAAKVAKLAIETAHIAEKAVTTAKLADLGVTEAKLAALAVTAAKLAAEAVETGKIKNLAVTTAKIALENVTTALIKDGAVTEAKLAEALKIALGVARMGVVMRKSKVVGDATATTETDGVASQAETAEQPTRVQATGGLFRLSNGKAYFHDLHGWAPPPGEAADRYDYIWIGESEGEHDVTSDPPGIISYEYNVGGAAPPDFSTMAPPRPGLGWCPLYIVKVPKGATKSSQFTFIDGRRFV